MPIVSNESLFPDFNEFPFPDFDEEEEDAKMEAELAAIIARRPPTPNGCAEFPFPDFDEEEEDAKMEADFLMMEQWNIKKDIIMEQMQRANVTIFLRLRKDPKENYVQLVSDDPVINESKYIFFELAYIAKIMGINLLVDDSGKLVITKLATLNKFAKQKTYIIDTDFEVILKDLYIRALELHNSPVVTYEYARASGLIKIINTNKLIAAKNGKLLANKLHLECRHIYNRFGKLKASTFNINTNILINNNGYIIGNNGTINAKGVNNDRGIISTANIKKYGVLSLELLKKYLENNKVTGGALTIRTKRLSNLERGVILAKRELLISSIRLGNVYNAVSKLLFNNQKSISCINAGFIASLESTATINFINNIKNLAQGVILAKKTLDVASMGKVFRDSNSTMFGSITKISGLDLYLEDLQGEKLHLNAYRKVHAPGLNGKYTLTVDVINGDGCYKNISCAGKAIINHHNKSTWELVNGQAIKQDYSNIFLEDCQFNQVAFTAKRLQVISISANHLQATINTLEYDQNSFAVNNLSIKFLQEHDINAPLNIPNIIDISGPKSTINAPITANKLVAKIEDLHHKKGEIATNDAKFDANNFATEDKINTKNLKVTVANRFLYDLELLRANNYDLTMRYASDLKLPIQPVAENYIARITSVGGIIELLHDIITGGFFILHAPWQQLLNNSEKLIRIHSGGLQNIFAELINLTKIGMYSNNGTKLHAKELLEIGQLPLNMEEAASYIRSLADIELISDTKKIILKYLDLISRLGKFNKILIQSPEMLDSISSTIWATDRIHLKVPYSIHRLIYEIIEAQRRSGNKQVLKKCVVKSRPGGIYSKELEVDGITDVVGSHLGVSRIIGLMPQKMEIIEEYEKYTVYQSHSREEWDGFWGEIFGDKKTIYWETSEEKKDVTETYPSTLNAFSDLDANFPEQANYVGGVIIGNAGVNLRYHDLTFRNPDSLAVNRQNFRPIISATEVIEPSNFFQIINNLNQQFLFNPVFGFPDHILEKFTKPIVVVTRNSGLVLDDKRQFTRLHHEQQEIEAYPKFVAKHNNLHHLDIGNHTNFEDLYWEAREYAVEQYREFINIANRSQDTAEQLLYFFNKITKLAIVYKEVECADGTTKVEFMSIAPDYKDKDKNNNIAGITARKKLTLRGDRNSTLDSTGIFHSEESDVNIAADSGSTVKIHKQQVDTNRTVADVDVERNFMKTKVNINYKNVTEKHIQEDSGAIVAPKGAININLEKRYDLYLLEELAIKDGVKVLVVDQIYFAKINNQRLKYMMLSIAATMCTARLRQSILLHY